MGQSNQPKEIYGGFWRRLVAFVLDAFILVVPTWIICHFIATFFIDDYMQMEDHHPEQLTLAIIQFIVQFSLSLAYFWYLQVKFMGTPGKYALGLRLVDESMKRPTLKQGFIRWLMTIPSTFILCGGYIAVGINTRKQGWHDRVAGTLVVRKYPAKAKKKVPQKAA